MKLYHYVHCPFCVRVRLVLGFLKLPFESIVLAYDDETTPIELTGKKMLPIMSIDGENINESLDTIKHLDAKNILQNELYSKKENEINDLLTRIGSDVHNLAMPYWIWSPEFNDNSRKYFQTKKEIKRGPFKNLVHDREKYTTNIIQTLESLIPKLTPFYDSNKLTILDIMIASHLWGLYIVPEFQFPPAVDNYLKMIKKECSFDYHEDFWK